MTALITRSRHLMGRRGELQVQLVSKYHEPPSNSDPRRLSLQRRGRFRGILSVFVRLKHGESRV